MLCAARGTVMLLCTSAAPRPRALLASRAVRAGALHQAPSRPKTATHVRASLTRAAGIMLAGG
ncbi:MAG: hypothetical protein MZV49_24560 [Rhodopseudomonas palustris]|nr:hypothetical protein [Rhodopseudomonas palustris]